ncbi:MAG: cbb3-type cytochrome c oxidase subunit 3 [Cellvibrionaceae bacterium]|nr:cbb3-type cytochrome c oxidase subunit 3 [Cellvibrionaceae bacterium]
MDINDWRGISTAFLMFAFIATWIWLWSSKRKKGFDEAANLPFADEEKHMNSSVDDARSRDGE